MATSTIKPKNTYEASGNTTVSVADTTATKLCELTLNAGTYLIFGATMFGKNSTGERIVNISTSVQKIGARNDTVAASPIATEMTPVQCFLFTKIGSQTTFYLNGWQNSGSSLTCYSVMTAIKLA